MQERSKKEASGVFASAIIKNLSKIPYKSHDKYPCYATAQMKMMIKSQCGDGLVFNLSVNSATNWHHINLKLKHLIVKLLKIKSA